MTIGIRIFLSILFTACVCVGSVILVERLSFEKALTAYIEQVELNSVGPIAVALEKRYAATGSWEFVEGKERWLSEVIRQSRANTQGRREGERRRADSGYRTTLPIRFGFGTSEPLWSRIGLLDTRGNWVAGNRAVVSSIHKDLFAQEKMIGQLVIEPSDSLDNQLNSNFNRQRLVTITMAGLLAVFGAAITGWLLARPISQRLSRLSIGAGKLSAGQYDARLMDSRHDELGQLSAVFDHLAKELEHSRDARQKWIADISHEIRTPITILKVELEALSDGLRPADEPSIRSLVTEVDRLADLVSDLHQLSRFDAGEIKYTLLETDVTLLLDELVSRYRDRCQSLDLTLKYIHNTVPKCKADKLRLTQVFVNIIENAIKYTDHGGLIKIAANKADDYVVVTFADSAPGVPADSLPKLFDRLYRVDPSRSRETGSSGIGLAICKNIVEAHNGSIVAEHSEYGGVLVKICLPISSG